MGFIEDVKKIIEDAEKRWNELIKGIEILKEAGEDVADREAEAKALKERIDGLIRGLKKVRAGK